MKIFVYRIIKSTIEIICISKYYQYVNHQFILYLKSSTVSNHENTLNPKVSTVHQPPKYLASQVNITLSMKILSISKYQQYVNHKKIFSIYRNCVMVSAVCHRSKHFVSQSINSTSAIKVLSISKYEQYVIYKIT